MPIAPYILNKEKRKTVCDWVQNLKFPYGYASNLGRCVDTRETSYLAWRGHDCHILMQRLFPVVFGRLLPNNMWNVLTELSQFLETFARQLCKLKTWYDWRIIFRKSFVSSKKYYYQASLTRWSIFLFTYLMRQRLEDLFSISGCIILKGKVSF